MVIVVFKSVSPLKYVASRSATEVASVGRLGREAIGQKMGNAYITLCKLDLGSKYIEMQLDYTASMTCI